jgi:hypothetical protein
MFGEDGEEKAFFFIKSKFKRIKSRRSGRRNGMRTFMG